MGNALARTLKGLGLDPSQAPSYHVRELSSVAAAKETGQQLGPCLAFDYVSAGEVLGTRYRRLSKSGPRYWQRPGTPPHLYFPHLPGLNWGAAIDGRAIDVLLITEGEKKALAVQAVLSKHPKLFPGHFCVSVPGTSTWSRQRPRNEEGDTDRSERRELLPALAALAKAGVRRAFVLFDSDKVGNQQVEADEELIARRLAELGVAAASVTVPPGKNLSKMGIDDHLAEFKSKERGTELRRLLDDAGASREAWPKAFATVEAAVEEMNKHAAMLPDMKVVFVPAGHDRFVRPVAPSVFATVAPQILAPLGSEGELKMVARQWLADPGARRIHAAVSTRQLPRGWGERDGVKFVNTFIDPPDVPAPSDADLRRYVVPFTEDLLVSQLGDDDARKLISIVAMHYQGTRPFYAIVLSGRGGDGKGLLGALLSRIYDWVPGYAGFVNTKGVKEPRFFEAACHERMFVRAEEVNTRQAFDLLRTQMDRQSSKEPKGKDAISSANDALILYATNNPEIIPLHQEADIRRLALFQFDWSFTQDPSKEPLRKQLDALLSDPRTAEVWRGYLQHLAWKKVVSPSHAPETQFRVELIEAGANDVDKWIVELLTQPPCPEGLGYVFTVGELTERINSRRLFKKRDALSPSFVLARLVEHSDLVERVAGGKKLKLDGLSTRVWARGPDRFEIAKIEGAKALSRYRQPPKRAN